MKWKHIFAALLVLLTLTACTPEKTCDFVLDTTAMTV